MTSKPQNKAQRLQDWRSEDTPLKAGATRVDRANPATDKEEKKQVKK